MPTLPDIDRLLTEDEWVRRLARRLVPDPHLADDLAQDVWVSALAGAGEVRSLRPWLGGVLRNLVRSLNRDEGRRARTEADSARSEALPSAAEVHEEVSLRRELATQLLELVGAVPLDALPALPSRPIAEEHRREHERASLDRARSRAARPRGDARPAGPGVRGKRSAWALALVPLARRSGGPATTAVGGLVMSTGVKVAASLLVAGVLRVPETAHTLVLLEDGQESGRRPLSLDPAQRTVVLP